MSSEREPMWYCHQCNAEMRPLMAPEPRCSSCQGSFVEKMENPADDPREFHQADFGIPNTALDFFALLLARSQEPRNSSSDTNHGSPRSSAGPFGQRALRVEFGNSNGRSTFVFGGPHVLLTGNRDSDRESETSGSNPPRLQDFVRAHASDDRGSNVPGYPIAQNLLALLTRGPLGLAGINNLSETPGRMGDFVFTQDALDQILTQIMEQSSANRPVPAPEEVVEKLPRTVLEDGDALLENDCAVCKEQFDSKAEDASEQIVITLPCKHVFHEGCILPWLKSSGTCPVCRFALVPQPNSSPREPGPSSSSSSGSSPPHSGVPPSPRMRRSSSDRSSSNDIISTTNPFPSEQMNPTTSSSSERLPGSFPLTEEEPNVEHRSRATASIPTTANSTRSTNSSRSSNSSFTGFISNLFRHNSGGGSSHSSSQSHRR